MLVHTLEISPKDKRMEENILSLCMQCFLWEEGDSHVIFIISPNESNKPYLDVKQLKVKPNRVRVLDSDIRHHIDSKRRIALIERKHRIADSARVIDHGDLEDRKDHNHQDNND